MATSKDPAPLHNCTSEPEEGGDPACWAHLFDEPEDGAGEIASDENEVGDDVTPAR